MNLLALAAIMFLAGLMALLRHNLWLGGGLVALSIIYVPLHIIRVRRFKRFDQGKAFE
jgi:hypothetical protein